MLPYLTALFVLFWQLNNERRWRPVFWAGRLKKVVNVFEKKVHPVTSLLEDFLTSKWPGSFTALAFAPDDLLHDLRDLEMTWLSWRPGAATAWWMQTITAYRRTHSRVGWFRARVGSRLALKSCNRLSWW